MDRYIGKFRYSNLNSQIYSEMLKTTIKPVIIKKKQKTNVTKEVSSFNRRVIAFPIKRGVTSLRILGEQVNEQVSQQWTGRRLSMKWPLPDLNPFDFFLRVNLKSKVVRSQPNSVDELKNRITQKYHRLSKDTQESYK